MDQSLAVIQEALLTLENNDPARAVGLFEQAITLKPDMPVLHYGKAIAQLRLGATDKGIEALNTLLLLVPTHAQGLQLFQNLTGREWSGPGAVRFDPTTPEGVRAKEFFDRTVKLLADGRPAQALATVDKVISFKLPIPGMHQLRSRCLTALGRYEEAYEDLRKHISLNPMDPEAAAEAKDLIAAIEAQNRQRTAGLIKPLRAPSAKKGGAE